MTTQPNPASETRATWRCPHCGGYDAGGIVLHCSGCGREGSLATPPAPAGELPGIVTGPCELVNGREWVVFQSAGSIIPPPGTPWNVPAGFSAVRWRPPTLTAASDEPIARQLALLRDMERESAKMIGDLTERLLAAEARLAEVEGELDAANKRLEPLGVKYGKDHSGHMTIGQLVEKLAACQDKDEFCDTIDAEFLFGAHGDWFSKTPPHWLLKDIRGLVYATVCRATTAETRVRELEAVAVEYDAIKSPDIDATLGRWLRAAAIDDNHASVLIERIQGWLAVRLRDLEAELAAAREREKGLREALTEIAERTIHFSELDVVDENWRQRRAQAALPKE